MEQVVSPVDRAKVTIEMVPYAVKEAGEPVVFWKMVVTFPDGRRVERDQMQYDGIADAIGSEVNLKFADIEDDVYADGVAVLSE